MADKFDNEKYLKWGTIFLGAEIVKYSCTSNVRTALHKLSV